MVRKKWTPKTEVDESLLHFREKRKWQIALRRYVLEKNKSSFYAPYFGLGIDKFRQWIEVQFDEGLSWDNFSSAWQFDHIVPVAYFNFSNEPDLRLCWNFLNIRVEKSRGNKDLSSRIDVLAAKKYFEVLGELTGYFICKEMVEKITKIEISELAGNASMFDFVKSHKEYLDTIKEFESADYDKHNAGAEPNSIVFEKNFLKRWS